MREILVGFDEAVLERLEAVAAGRKRAGFIRAAVEAALAGRTFEPTVQAYARDISEPAPVARPKPVVVPADGPIPIGDALSLAGLEVMPGQVIALPRAKASGRGVDADRVIACLRERRRSARDVANALKMDLGTAGLVLADLIRDGVVRKRVDKVLELVE